MCHITCIQSPQTLSPKFGCLPGSQHLLVVSMIIRPIHIHWPFPLSKGYQIPSLALSTFLHSIKLVAHPIISPQASINQMGASRSSTSYPLGILCGLGKVSTSISTSAITAAYQRHRDIYPLHQVHTLSRQW